MYTTRSAVPTEPKRQKSCVTLVFNASEVDLKQSILTDDTSILVSLISCIYDVSENQSESVTAKISIV